VNPESSLTSSENHTAQALESLRQRFAQLPDQRQPGRTSHRLDVVLMIAVCSMLSDNGAFTEMETFARTQLPWLRTFLPIPHGVPSHDVFRNVFIMLKPATLVGILQDWCGELFGRHIAVDGKAMRGTIDTATGKYQVHVLRAWVTALSLSAGQVTCAEKSNEIEALPRLLATLRLKGAIVTIDAMGTQSAIAAQIHDAEAHYVIALKLNQKGAFQAVSGHFDEADLAGTPPAHHHTIETSELSHGRYERREYTVTSALAWFHKSWKWAGLKSVVRVRRWTHRGQESAELVLETHYYLTTLPADPTLLAGYIRGHWSIENQCHHVLDVTYQEDHSQVRDDDAAHNLSILREMSLHVLKRHHGKGSLRSKRKRAALDPAFRTELLASIPHTFGA